MVEDCKYYHAKEKLDSVTEKWLLDEKFDIPFIRDMALTSVISPERKCLCFVVYDPYGEEAFVKQLDIKYFPFCGRKI